MIWWISAGLSWGSSVLMMRCFVLSWPRDEVERGKGKEVVAVEVDVVVHRGDGGAICKVWADRISYRLTFVSPLTL